MINWKFLKLDPELTKISMQYMDDILTERARWLRDCCMRGPLDYQYGTWWRCRNCGTWVEKNNG